MSKSILLISLLFSSLAWASGPPSEDYSVASLMPGKQVIIRSEVAGVVDSYQFENGDLVDRGDALLSISNRDYQLALNLAKFELDVTNSELESHDKQLKRYQSLFATKTISASDLDNQLRLTNVSRAQRNVSQVKYDIAKETLAKSSPGAPFAGTVINRAVELGQFIAVGDPFYTLADTHKLKARFHLLEADFNRLNKGDTVKVTVPSIGKDFSGEVTLLSPAIQTGDPGFLVEVTLDNTDSVLNAGMESHVYLDSKPLADEVSR